MDIRDGYIVLETKLRASVRKLQNTSVNLVVDLIFFQLVSTNENSSVNSLI